MSFSAKVLFVVLFGFIAIGSANGQLRADDVSDGPCTNVPIAENFTTACVQQLIKPIVYSVYIGSNAVMRGYAESFLGRPAKDQAELDQLCLTIEFIDSVAIQSGFVTKTNIQQAVPIGLNPTAILPTPLGLGKFAFFLTYAQSPGSTVANQNFTVDTFHWCDGVKHALLVRCINGIRQDWKVVSDGDPDPWVFPLMQQKIAALGMPAENAVQYKSVTQGGNCPVVPDLTGNTVQALTNVGLPIPTGPVVQGLVRAVGSPLQVALNAVYKVIGVVFTAATPITNLL